MLAHKPLGELSVAPLERFYDTQMIDNRP